MFSALRPFIGFSVLLTTIAVPVHAQEGNWRRDLTAELEARYPTARLSWDGRNLRAPGVPLLLMQPNVLAERSLFTNHVRDGVLQAPGRMGFMSDLLRQAQDNDATRDRVSLPLYQPVYLTTVRVSNTTVVLEVATIRQFIQESVDRAAIARFVDGTSLKGDTLTKTDVSVRRAALVIEFARGTLEKMTVDDVVAEIDKILLRADDPKAPKFGTVELGMARDQVLINLGKPMNVISLGEKEILVYPRIKVTLVAGQVTDVE